MKVKEKNEYREDWGKDKIWTGFKKREDDDWHCN